MIECSRFRFAAQPSKSSSRPPIDALRGADLRLVRVVQLLRILHWRREFNASSLHASQIVFHPFTRWSPGVEPEQHHPIRKCIVHFETHETRWPFTDLSTVSPCELMRFRTHSFAKGSLPQTALE
jgi:hypothetical protein